MLLRRQLSKLMRFLAGPTPPRPLPVIQPLLTLSVTLPQSTSPRCLNPDVFFTKHYLVPFRRRFPHGGWKHGLTLALYLAAWLIGFSFLVRANSFLASTEPAGEGGVQALSCTSTFWTANDGCGLNGESCLPSNLTEPISFRCPAGCSSQIVYNPRSIGALRPDYVPLIVGGGQPAGSELIYRAE